jgi:hypothetical protein
MFPELEPEELDRVVEAVEATVAAPDARRAGAA